MGLALLLALLGCKDKEHGTEFGENVQLRAETRAEDHTFRISEPRAGDGDLGLKIFTDEVQCLNAGIEETELCTPLLDRATGQVRLAFQPRYQGTPVALPLTGEHILVIHDGFEVRAEGGQRVEVIPHEPDTGQARLFILLIDGSGSMREMGGRKASRIERVRRGLLLDDVVARFFPEGEDTAVVLLSFASGQPKPVGGDLKVIRSPKKYRRLVGQLDTQSGYTHLYDAVEYATGALMEEPAVRTYLQDKTAQPVIVLLTDGFNNEDDIRTSGRDVCGDNGKRLSELLVHLDQQRDMANHDADQLPIVYAVGLGKQLKGSKKLVEQVNSRTTDVDPVDLCGRANVQTRIDGVLEKQGIDRASLEWIARHGGGFAYVRRDARGLGEAFKEAAATRYSWYELRYQLDPAYLKRTFEVSIRLTALAQAESTVAIAPSAWMDPPKGWPSQDPQLSGWVERSPYGDSATLVMMLLGGAVGLAFLGGALFNVSRIATGRRKPRKHPGD